MALKSHNYDHNHDLDFLSHIYDIKCNIYDVHMHECFSYVAEIGFHIKKIRVGKSKLYTGYSQDAPTVEI